LADSLRKLLVQDQLAVLARFTKGWALKVLLLVLHSTSAVVAVPVVEALAVVVPAVSLPPPQAVRAKQLSKAAQEIGAGARP
jgi:hypothetical protein